MESAKHTSFAALLRRYRLAAGLTQATLAERAGLSERAVNDLERDPERVPRLESVMLLTDALALPQHDRAQLLSAARPELRSPEDSLLSEIPFTSAQPSTTPAPVTAAHVEQPPVSLPHSDPLPAASTPFVGRAHDMTAVCTRLREPGVRLLTLTGSGGIGKTRLALHVAAALEGAYADGVRFVALGSLADPGLVLPTIMAALGIPESGHQTPARQLVETLRSRELLLVLDNFEQVTSVAVELERLLAACPALTILVTSRAVLHLAREHEYPVPPLMVPDLAHLPALSDLIAYDSVELLVQCARATVPDFLLTETNAWAIAAICTRLEGVPLAIQLAAARIKLLPPAALLSRLDQQLAILTGGPQDAPERQRTVRATLDWSYRLLTPLGQMLFRRLAVFVGGWTLDAAEGICSGGGVERSDILDLLGQLVDQSLVLVDVQEGMARYRLLKTVRQYAVERLQEAGEETEMRERHLTWFLEQAKDVDSQIWIMPFPAALSALKPEADNFRTALAWSRRDASGQTALQLAGALTIMWQAAGAVNEGRRVLRDALDCAGLSVRTTAHARALLAAGNMASLQTDPVGAIPLLDQAITAFQELGDERNLARALTVAARVRHWAGDWTAFSGARDEPLRICRKLGNLRALTETLWLWADLELERGEYTVARQQLDECIAVCRQLNDSLFLSFPLISLARVACAEGDVDQARMLAEEGLSLREAAPLWLLAIALVSLGEVERYAGRDERASDVFWRGLAIFRSQDDSAGIAWSLHNLGHIALRSGDASRAAGLFTEALIARYRHGYLNGVAAGLAGIASVCCLVGDYARAAELYGAAEALLESSGSVLTPADAIAYEHDTATLHARMEASELKASWATGRAYPLEKAISEALSIASMQRGGSVVS